jgi:pilus assembly protein Flp/PilA
MDSEGYGRTQLRQRSAWPRLPDLIQARQIMMNNLKKLVRDESGASAAGYALILAIIGTGIAAAAISLGEAIATSMNKSSACLKTAASC